MRILFGPQHDALHVDPAHPGAYEWWYFDAVSDDGRWALVTIFFLGSPMSPYYKAVATGRRSTSSLYDFTLATYDEGDSFDQSLAKGFIELWGLPSKIAARRGHRSSTAQPPVGP